MRFFSLFASSLLALSLPSYGCGLTLRSESTTPSVFDDISQTRRVEACYVVYPPSVTTGSDPKTPGGFLVDLFNEIAKRAEYSVSYQPVAIKHGTAALGSRCQILIAPTFITIHRAERTEFTRPIVLWKGISALALEERISDFNQLSDLNKPNVRIAVLSGTAQADFSKRHFPQANISMLTTDDISTTFLEVVSGRADVALASNFLIKKFVSSQPKTEILFDGKVFNQYAVAFQLPSGAFRWKNFLDNAIFVLQTDGTILSLINIYESEQEWILPH